MNEQTLHELTTSFTRRGALGLVAALGTSYAAPGRTLRKPKALRPGDTVAVIMPSTQTPDPDQLAKAARTVEYFGLRMKKGKNLGQRVWNFERSAQARVQEIHEAFADPEVKAVFPVGGGYGTMQILERLDYGLIGRNPKIFAGYSDITALHLAFQKLAGLVTFHAPMMLSSFTEYTQQIYRKALFQAEPLGTVTNPPTAGQLRTAHALRTVRPGRARGRLVGGNLTLIALTMGTPYEIDTKDCILMLEDVGEETYSIDRMLTQLHLAGKLEQAAGIVWGECDECGPRTYKASTATPFTVGETIDNLLGRLKTPVLSGFTFGHTADQATLPLGVMATLDADKGELTIEEPATVS